MKNMNNGDIILFQQGKNGKQIAYAEGGKVIISKENIPCGYASVKSFEEKPKCFIVEAEHLYAHDYYTGITYQEFLQLLRNYNFNVTTCKDSGSNHQPNGSSWHQIFAEHKVTNVTLYAKTHNGDGNSYFSTIEVCVPGQDGRVISVNSLRVTRGNKYHAVFDIVNVQGGMSKVMKIAHSIPKDKRTWESDYFFDGYNDLKESDIADATISKSVKGMVW